MLRIHYLRQWFGLSDPAMEEGLHDAPLYREFAKLDGATARSPDETTILRFRHLLERYDLARDMLRVVNDIPASSSFRREGRLYWQCARCRHQCTVISGTIFAATKLPLSHWFLAMHLLTQAKNNVSALELKRHLGVSYTTAWLVKHKLMEVMRQREDSRQLTGRVEVDDAYLGGERSGGKVGRGSENKVPFIAAVQTTEDGKPVVVCLAPAPFTTEAVEAYDLPLGTYVCIVWREYIRCSLQTLSCFVSGGRHRQVETFKAPCASVHSHATSWWVAVPGSQQPDG